MSGSFNTLFDPSAVGQTAPNALAPQPTWADAWQFNAEHAQAELERQRAISEQRGLWGPNGPTPAGARDAAQQTAMGVIMGTTAPEARLSLDRVAQWKGAGNIDNHTYLIKHPSGDYIGGVDTTWNPATGELNVGEIRADQGPNSMGPAAIRQLRDTLLEQYPDTKLITGDRISGAGAGRRATQKVKD